MMPYAGPSYYLYYSPGYSDSVTSGGYTTGGGYTSSSGGGFGRSYEPGSYASRSYEPGSYASRSYEPSSYAKRSYEPNSFAKRSYEPSSFAPNSGYGGSSGYGSSNQESRSSFDRWIADRERARRGGLPQQEDTEELMRNLQNPSRGT